MLRSTTAAIVAGAALIACLAAPASPAAAQSFSPAPGNYTLSGPVTFTDTHVYTCDATISISVNAVGAATVLSRSLSGPGWCGLAVVPAGSWTIAPGPGFEASIVMGFNTGITSCYGLVTAALTAPSTFEWPNTDLPGSPAAFCRVRGELTATPALTVVP